MGAGVLGEKIPTIFYEASDKYLEIYKKLALQARKDGNMEEKASDPITFSMHISIIQ